jgi:hypothetical protein
MHPIIWSQLSKYAPTFHIVSLISDSTTYHYIQTFHNEALYTYMIITAIIHVNQFISSLIENKYIKTHIYKLESLSATVLHFSVVVVAVPFSIPLPSL